MNNDHKEILIDSSEEVLKGLGSAVIASAIGGSILAIGAEIPVAVGITILSAVSKKRFISSEISIKKLVVECIKVADVESESSWLEPQIVALLNKVQLDPGRLLNEPRYLSLYSNELAKGFEAHEREMVVRVINLAFTALAIAVRDSSEYQAELQVKVQELDLKVGEIEYSVDYLWRTLNELSEQVSGVMEKGICSTKKAYLRNNQKNYFIEKWNESLFLHPHIKLKDMYMPLSVKAPMYNTTDVTEIVEEYLNDDTKELLLILGNPGMGKSSFMSYLANKYANNENFIFIKMQDLESAIAKNSISDAIADFMNCRVRDLREAVLFLDGYDELRVDGAHYELCVDFITQLQHQKIKTILSSRKNYIDLDKEEFQNDFKRSWVVELKPFSKAQVISYIKKYKDVTEEPVDSLLHNIEHTQTDMDVFGIPFILYLICALSINISEIDSIISVYEKVFSFDGGLYDKIYDKNTGHYLTQNPQRKRELIKISEEIAYEMFRENRLYALNEDIENKILEKYPKSKSTFAIGNYYHIENDKTYFAHKTFQEYFVACYLFHSLEDLLDKIISGKAVEDEAIQILFNLFYCNNYIYKRLDIIFEKKLLSITLKDEKYRCVLMRLVPQLYRLYFENIYYDLKPINHILKSQNYLSSIHKIINHFRIDTFYGLDECEAATIIRSKQYVHLDIKKLTLNKVDLSGSFLRGTISECQWNDILLNRTDLMKSIWANTTISHFNIRLAYGESVNFLDCYLQHGFVERSVFYNSKAESSELGDLSVRNTQLDKLILNKITAKKLTVADLNGNNVEINNCEFANSKFNNYLSKEGNRLEEVKFRTVTFKECRFTFEIFSRVTYKGCQFINCVFENCNMNSTIFRNCMFKVTEFLSCDFVEAQFINCTFYSENDSQLKLYRRRFNNKVIIHMGMIEEPDKNKANLDVKYQL